MRFWPKWIRDIYTYAKWKKLQKICDTEFDIIWSFDNSVFYDLDALPEKVLKVSHMVDLNQNFQFEKATRSADLCIAVSDYILERQLTFNKNSFKITHGYSSKQIFRDLPQLPGQNRIKAMYVGNLAMSYLDWATLYEACENNSLVDFIFIGPGKEDVNPGNNPTYPFKEKVLKLDHCYFIERIPSEHLMGFLQVSDLLLICYQEKYHKEQSNPHKLMEYLASGKPIVATYTSEYIELRDLIQMSKENRQWPGKFRETISNLEKLSSPDITALRSQFAIENTYDKQISKIELIINRN